MFTFNLISTHLVSCEAEYNTWALAGPVDHKMKMTVVEIEGRADSLVLDQSSLTLHLTCVPPDPEAVKTVILGVSEDALDSLLLVHMATVEAVSAAC